jgi:sugar phosphate isomerase/epimerase
MSDSKTPARPGKTGGPAQPARRDFLLTGAALTAGGLLGTTAAPPSAMPSAKAVEPPTRLPPTASAGNPTRFKVALAAYSFRKFLERKKDKDGKDIEPAWTYPVFLEKAAEVGAEGVEILEYFFAKPVAAKDVTEVKRRAHLLGLSVCNAPVGNVFTHPAGPDRDKQLEHVRNWLDVAADMGAPCIRIFAGSTPKGMTDEAARKNVVECIDAVTPHAEKRGVWLALENHGGVVATPDGLLEILKASGSPWLGVNLDTGNFHGEDPYADLAKVAPYAVTVQYKVDITPKGGKKEASDPARIAKILRDSGYRGWVALEYESAEDPLTAVPRHIAELRKALA